MTVKEVTPEIKKRVEAYMNCASLVDELIELCDTNLRYRRSVDCQCLAREIRLKTVKLACAVGDMSEAVFEFFGITEEYLSCEKNLERVTDILCSDNSIDDICKDLIELEKRWD